MSGKPFKVDKYGRIEQPGGDPISVPDDAGIHWFCDVLNDVVEDVMDTRINSCVCSHCGHTLILCSGQTMDTCPWCHKVQVRHGPKPLPPSNVPGFGSNVWMDAARRERELGRQLLQRARMLMENLAVENRHDRQVELCKEITAYLHEDEE